MTCSCSLVPNSIKQSISHPVYNLKMVVKVTRDDQQSHYTRFGVTIELATYIQTRKENIATVWKFHATVDELKASMEDLAMEVAEFFDQFVPTS